jgi:hypothetical protein
MLKNDAKLRKHLWEISHLATSLGASPLGHHFWRKMNRTIPASSSGARANTVSASGIR